MLCCLLSNNVLARSSTDDYGSNGGLPYVISASVGPAWTKTNQSQTVYVTPTVQNLYIAQPVSHALKFVSVPKGTRTIATGELFLGVHFAVNSVVESQVGLALATSSQAKPSGRLYIGGNPNPVSYSYKVQNSRVALKVKSIINSGFYDLNPYLSASGGLGFNRASSFMIPPGLVQGPLTTFADRSNKAFSYTFGVGVQTPLDDNWQMGLGYEWANWGYNRLGFAPGQIQGGGLRLKNLRTQELQITLSYSC